MKRCCETCKYFNKAEGIEIWCDKWEDIFAYKRWNIKVDYCSKWKADKPECDGKITPHWLEVAHERWRAGENEVDILEDYGYVRETTSKKLDNGKSCNTCRYHNTSMCEPLEEHDCWQPKSGDKPLVPSKVLNIELHDDNHIRKLFSDIIDCIAWLMERSK